jgi:hypothetical protein
MARARSAGALSAPAPVSESVARGRVSPARSERAIDDGEQRRRDSDDVDRHPWWARWGQTVTTFLSPEGQGRYQD